MSDPIRPDHYTEGMPNGIQVWDIIEAQHSNYSHGAAIKYLLRAKYKENLVQDYRKCIAHLEREIDRIEAPAPFVFPTEPHSVISAQGHTCHDTDPEGRTKFVLTGAERWMCDCSTWPETTIRQDLTNHRNEATI